MCIPIKERSIPMYIVQKQHLLEKQHRDDLERLIIDQLALHSTDYLTPYISLWARLKDFTASDLFDLLESSKILRKRAFRGTVFLIHQKNLPTLSNLSDSFAGNWIKGLQKELKKSNFDLKSFEKDVVANLKGKNFATTRQLSSLLESEYEKSLISLTLRYLELKSIIVRTNQRYPTDKVISYGLMEEIFPKQDSKKYTQKEAQIEIFIRYMHQFGPASLDDFCWWLPAKKTDTKNLIKDLEEKIQEITFQNQTYYILKEECDQIQKIKSTRSSVFFLPYEDHFPKAYFNRDWFLTPALTQIIMGQGVTMRGQLMPTIWYNYRIVGKWRIEYTNKKKNKAEIAIEHIEEHLSSNSCVEKEINEVKTSLQSFINQFLSFNEEKKKN